MKSFRTQKLERLCVGCALVMPLGLVEIRRLSVSLRVNKIGFILAVLKGVVCGFPALVDTSSYNLPILTVLLFEPLLAEQQTEIVVVNRCVRLSIEFVLH